MMMLNGVVLENFRAYSHKRIYHIIFDHMKRPYNFLDTQTLDELEVLKVPKIIMKILCYHYHRNNTTFTLGEFVP